MGLGLGLGLGFGLGLGWVGAGAISLSVRHWKRGSPCCSHSAKMQPKDHRSTAEP